MAWPKQMTAEEILGMKPEEMKTKLEGAATKDDINAIKTEFSNTLTEIQNALKALTPAPVVVPDPVADADASDPTTQILSDPSGFISRQTAPIQQTALQTRADMLEMRARQKYSGAFNQFNDLLTQTAAKVPLAARSQENFWDLHIRTVIGDQMLNGKIDQGNYPSLMGSSSFAPQPGDPSDPNKGFSAEQAAFFRERGVPLDRAAKINQIMSNGDHLTLEAFKGKAGNA